LTLAKWRAANPEKIKEGTRRWNAANAERKRRYMREWSQANANDPKRKANRRKVARKRLLRLSADPFSPKHSFILAQKMCTSARARAKSANLAFSLVPEDVLPLPSHCPVLGMELLYASVKKGQDASASLDRIDNSQGYVPGNVAVISMRANLIKNNATLTELQAIVRYMEVHKAIPY
jgi:hypothetical protein